MFDLNSSVEHEEPKKLTSFLISIAFLPVENSFHCIIASLHVIMVIFVAIHLIFSLFVVHSIFIVTIQQRPKKFPGSEHVITKMKNFYQIETMLCVSNISRCSARYLDTATQT